MPPCNNLISLEDSFDFSRIFDDEQFADDVPTSASKELQQHDGRTVMPFPLNSAVAPGSSNPTESWSIPSLENNNAIFFPHNQQQPQPHPPSQQQLQQLLAPPSNHALDQLLVNLFLIVDPSSQQVIFPNQLVSFQQSVASSFLENVTASSDYPKDGGTLSSPPAAQLRMSPLDVKSTMMAPSASALPSRSFESHSPQSMIEQQGFLMNVTGINPLTKVTELGTFQPPVRALSAYNFFFRDERERILHGGDQNWSLARQELLLSEHWSRDRNRKRRHRKTHGKIDFTTLSKLISTRWKELPEDGKNFYREIATRDWDRYQTEMTHYKNTTGATMGPNPTYQSVIG